MKATKGYDPVVARAAGVDFVMVQRGPWGLTTTVHFTDGEKVVNSNNTTAKALVQMVMGWSCGGSGRCLRYYPTGY